MRQALHSLQLLRTTAKLNYKKTKAKGPTPHTARGSSSNPRYDPRRRPRCGRGRDTSLQNWQARSHTHPAPNYPLPLFVSVSLSLRPPPPTALPHALSCIQLSALATAARPFPGRCQYVRREQVFGLLTEARNRLAPIEATFAVVDPVGRRPGAVLEARVLPYRPSLA